MANSCSRYECERIASDHVSLEHFDDGHCRVVFICWRWSIRDEVEDFCYGSPLTTDLVITSGPSGIFPWGSFPWGSAWYPLSFFQRFSLVNLNSPDGHSGVLHINNKSLCSGVLYADGDPSPNYRVSIEHIPDFLNVHTNHNPYPEYPLMDLAPLLHGSRGILGASYALRLASCLFSHLHIIPEQTVSWTHFLPSACCMCSIRWESAWIHGRSICGVQSI